MSTAVLKYAPGSDFTIGKRTALASVFGRRAWGNQLRAYASRTAQQIDSEPLSFEERLNTARAQTEKAIRRRAGYFSDEMMNELISRTRAIFDPGDWHEGEPIPDMASASCILRAIVAIGGQPSIGVAGTGNMTATWQDEHHSLSIEAKPSGTYKWAYVIEQPDEFVCHGQDDSRLADVIEALA